MPKSAMAKKQKDEIIRGLIVYVGILLALLIILDSIVFAVKITKKNDIKGQDLKIQELQGAEINKDVLDTVRNKIEDRQNILKEIYNNRTEMTIFIENLEQLVPKDVNLTKLSIGEDRQVIIQGKANKEESVLDFYHNLKTSNIGDYVNFDKISGTVGNREGFEFMFKFILKGGK